MTMLNKLMNIFRVSVRLLRNLPYEDRYMIVTYIIRDQQIKSCYPYMVEECTLPHSISRPLNFYM